MHAPTSFPAALRGRPPLSVATAVVLVVAGVALPACGSEEPAAAGGDVAAETPADQRGLVVLDDGIPAPPGVPDRPDFHSFGEVPDGETATHTFRLRNVEDEPIAITGIHPGCGCTAAAVRATTPDGDVLVGGKPDDPSAPWIVVPPGSEVELTLDVDTRDIASKNRDRTLTTRMVTDAEAGRYRTFEVHLYVAQDLQVSPRVLKLAEVPVGEGGVGTVDVVPVGARRLEPAEVVSAPPGVEVEVVPTDILGHAAWQVQARLDPPLELGSAVGTIELATRRQDGSDGPRLTIPYQARVVPDLEVDPARLVLVQRGEDQLEASARLTSRLPGERLRVEDATLVGQGAEAFELAAEPDGPDSRGRSHAWTLTLRPRGGAADGWPTEVLRGEAVLRLERASEGEVRVPWVYHPR